MSNEINVQKVLDNVVDAELGNGSYGDALGISAEEVELMEECLYNYYSSRDIEQARFCAETILTTVPGNFYARMILIQLDIETDCFQKALDQIEELMRVYEQDDLIDLKWAQCQLLLGQREGVEEVVERLTRSEIPYVATDAKVLYNLCYAEDGSEFIELDGEGKDASSGVDCETSGKKPPSTSIDNAEKEKELVLAA